MTAHHIPDLRQSTPSPDVIRSRFARALSDMYRKEVPQYSELVDLVAEVNARVLEEDAALALKLKREGNLDRLGIEQHGAVRVGTAQELNTLRRMFAVMGMEPVGYYDLSAAGVPVHSTAFRALSETGLRTSPLRVFVSLIRLELVEDQSLRSLIEDILARRHIFASRALELIERWETSGVLTNGEADEFVQAALETFRWRCEASVDEATYAKLLKTHRLLADVVCFRGPHINHLTIQSLDIDAAQDAMHASGLNAKDVVEGPPRRRCPILLRQTSFKAVSESVRFVDGSTGSHTARFGEIEQRGVALTRKGRALYDQLLAEGGRKAAGMVGDANNAHQLRSAFAAFPDSHDQLRTQGLGCYRYALTSEGLAQAGSLEFSLEEWIRNDWVKVEPIEYQDFLPISAAGIFQSNLGSDARREYSAQTARTEFEAALGATVHDEIAIYECAQRNSLDQVLVELTGEKA